MLNSAFFTPREPSIFVVQNERFNKSKHFGKKTGTFSVDSKPLYIKGASLQLPYNQRFFPLADGHYIHGCNHVVALSPVFMTLYVNLQLQQRT